MPLKERMNDSSLFLVVYLERLSTYIGRLEKNPMDISKSSERFRDSLSKTKDLTGVDPFELMEIVEDKER